MGTFTASIKAFNKKTQDRIDITCMRITRELFEGIILSTPVLTGRLRNNWFAMVNGYSNKSTAYGAPVGTATLERMRQVVTRGAFANRDTFVTLTNHTHYAYKIEYLGWSKYKAPQGMVRINLAYISAKYA